MIWGVGIETCVGLLIISWLYFLARKWRDEAKKQRDLALTQTQRANQAEAREADEFSRHQNIIQMLKNEIASLEQDLLACSDPSAVRARLRKLLAAPEADVSTGPAPLPHGTSPGTGAGKG